MVCDHATVHQWTSLAREAVAMRVAANMGAGTWATPAAVSPSMLRLCCTNSSWLQGLWKKAESQVSFQMRECSWRHRSSGVLRAQVLPEHQGLPFTACHPATRLPLRQRPVLHITHFGMVRTPGSCCSCSTTSGLAACAGLAASHHDLTWPSVPWQAQDAQ